MGYYLTEPMTDMVPETEPAAAPSRVVARPPIGAPFWKTILSTKYWDSDTKTLAFQLRDYGPGLGRWLSRDPIEEQGGRNLFAFCKNDSNNKVDFIGLQENTCSTASMQMSGQLDKNTVSNAGKDPEYLVNVILKIIIIGPIEQGGDPEDVEITPPGGIFIKQRWDPLASDAKNGTTCRKKNICQATCENSCCKWPILWEAGHLRGRVASELVNDLDPERGYRNATCEIRDNELKAGLNRCKNSNPSCQ